MDEIRAGHGARMAHRHYTEFKMKHWKPEGGNRLMRTNFMHGEIYYLTGGSKLFSSSGSASTDPATFYHWWRGAVLGLRAHQLQ